MMFLSQRIEELMMHHHDARYAVAEFVLHEKKNIQEYTIDDIAQHSYTSKATVVRFAKTLGFKGWCDFIKAYIAEVRYDELHQGDVDANYPFTQANSTSEILDNIKKLQIESIQDTFELMDLSTLNKATDYLYKANRVVIFGLSPNVYLGELFKRKMITIGKNIEVANLGEMAIVSRTLKSDDCAILVSYSGNNQDAEPMCYLPILLKQKVKMIGITSGGNNYLREHLSCVFTMSSKERLYTKISTFASEESIQYIFNALYANYYSKAYQENNQFKIQNAKIIENKRQSVIHNKDKVS